MDIEAYAFHIDGGVTLPVPMAPRLSAEFNTASGNKGDGKWRSFDQLYPTNHIHFGYMDRMSWKNMNHLAFGLQLRPNKDSHFEVTGHLFSRQESTDGVYHAGQAQFLAPITTTRPMLGKKSTWSIPISSPPGITWPGKSAAGFSSRVQFIDNSGPRGGNASEQTWGYTQLWVNF